MMALRKCMPGTVSGSTLRIGWPKCHLGSTLECYGSRQSAWTSLKGWNVAWSSSPLPLGRLIHVLRNWSFSYSFQAGEEANPNLMLISYMGLFSSLLVLIRAHPRSRAWATDFNLIAVAIPLRRQARRTPVNRIPQIVALRSKGLANVSPA